MNKEEIEQFVTEAEKNHPPFESQEEARAYWLDVCDKLKAAGVKWHDIPTRITLPLLYS